MGPDELLGASDQLFGGQKYRGASDPRGATPKSSSGLPNPEELLDAFLGPRHYPTPNSSSVLSPEELCGLKLPF
jgi:hypothetical protein